MNKWIVLLKAEKVIKSVTSPDQVAAASKFLDLAYKCISKEIAYKNTEEVDLLDTEYEILKLQLQYNMTGGDKRCAI